jgi:hypothetical protein
MLHTSLVLKLLWKQYGVAVVVEGDVTVNTLHNQLKAGIVDSQQERAKFAADAYTRYKFIWIFHFVIIG